MDIKTYAKAKLRLIPGLVPLVRLCRLALLPGYRSEWRLARSRPDNLFQPFSTTAPDRYPRVFSFLRDRMPEGAPLRVLSYGCSTGEEVFTLRRYFPDAEIVGVDINPSNIAVCHKKQKRSPDSRLRFAVAASPQAEPEAYYDVILCMSVLRHGELEVKKPENCSHLICFADFERIVSELGRCLKPGGFLAIANSHFRFAETAVAEDFEVAYRVEPRANRTTSQIYDKRNIRLDGVTYSDVVFCKRMGT
ncbi:MAG TPA: class I SAM-dependent methyltransferase [Rhodocyclaceae bacterium]|nr:class I SAM-dependent methyltransferase [Rhodocyclaceae bacterium]